MRKKDHRGSVFGKLTVIEELPKLKTKLLWLCRCDCGREVSVTASNLVTRNTTSCGICIKSPYSPSERCLLLHWNNYKNNAKNRKVEFKLDYLQFTELVTKNCYYCGSTPQVTNFQSYVGADYSPEFRARLTTAVSGIDRKNPAQGYIADNCVPCCSFCNYAKHRLTEQEYVDLCCRVASFKKSC